MLRLLSIFSALKGMTKTPNVLGLSQSQAQSSITNSNLKLGNVGTLTTSNSSIDGQVASQFPAPNTLVKYESAVDLTVYTYVSTPTPTPTPTPPTPTPTFTTVPNIISQTVADANYTLTLSNLYGAGTATSTTSQELDNVVWQQDPTSGTVVPEFSFVYFDYYVWDGFTPTPTPTPPTPVPFSFFGFTPFNFTPQPFSFFGFTPAFAPFAFFGFFGFTPAFTPFTFFGFFGFIPFAFFGFFGFTPVYATPFSFFGFTPFNFTPKFSFFGFIPFSFFGFTPSFR